MGRTCIGAKSLTSSPARRSIASSAGCLGHTPRLVLHIRDTTGYERHHRLQSHDRLRTETQHVTERYQRLRALRPRHSLSDFKETVVNLTRRERESQRERERERERRGRDDRLRILRPSLHLYLRLRIKKSISSASKVDHRLETNNAGVSNQKWSRFQSGVQF